MTGVQGKTCGAGRVIFRPAICPRSGILQLLNYQKAYGIQ